jgi:hypothetical protein
LNTLTFSRPTIDFSSASTFQFSFDCFFNLTANVSSLSAASVRFLCQLNNQAGQLNIRAADIFNHKSSVQQPKYKIIDYFRYQIFVHEFLFHKQMPADIVVPADFSSVVFTVTRKTRQRKTIG